MVAISVQDGICYGFRWIETYSIGLAFYRLDAREVWIIVNFWGYVLVATARGFWCLSIDGEMAKDARLKLVDCFWAERSGNGMHRWLMDENESLHAWAYYDYCIVLANTQLPINIALHQYARATSSLNDGQHNPSNAVDGNDKTYWASAYGSKEQIFTLYFSQVKTAREIIVKWKYPPKECDILILNKFYTWQNVYTISSTEDTTRVRFGVQQIVAVRLYMYENDKAKGIYRKLPIYGINSLEILSGGATLSMQKCADYKDQKNHWWTFYDIDSFYWTRYEAEELRNWLYYNVNCLIILLHKLTLIIIEIKKMIEHMIKVRATLILIEKQLLEYDQNYAIQKLNYDLTIKLLFPARINEQSDELGSNSNTPAQYCF